MEKLVHEDNGLTEESEKLGETLETDVDLLVTGNRADSGDEVPFGFDNDDSEDEYEDKTEDELDFIANNRYHQAGLEFRQYFIENPREIAGFYSDEEEELVEYFYSDCEDLPGEGDQVLTANVTEDCEDLPEGEDQVLASNVTEGTCDLKPDPEVEAFACEGVPDPEVEDCVREGVPDPEVEDCAREGVPDPEVEDCAREGVPDPEVEDCAREGVPDPEVKECACESVPEDGMEEEEVHKMTEPDQNGVHVEEGYNNTNVDENGATMQGMPPTGVIDMSEQLLESIPDHLLKLPFLHHLYLTENKIELLPDFFFRDLPNLIWLDLRWNRLKALPSAYVGGVQWLETLLLEGNQLRTLPLELGLVTSLRNLNLCRNPLEFPPKEIVAQGVQGMLTFLRQMLRAKTHGEPEPDGEVYHILNMLKKGQGNNNLRTKRIGKWTKGRTNIQRRKVDKAEQYMEEMMTGYDSDGEDSISKAPLSQRSAPHTAKTSRYSEARSSEAEPKSDTDLIVPTQKAVSLRERLAPPPKTLPQKIPPNSTKPNNFSVKKKRKPVALVESRMPHDKVEHKHLEEAHREKVKEIKLRQEMVLQKRRDAEQLKDFREKSKELQRKKALEKMRQGGVLVYEEPADSAPYGFDKSRMKMMSNEERLAYDPREMDQIKQRPMSPTALAKLDEARKGREHELRKRLKEHKVAVAERKNKGQGPPTHQMEAALKELHIAEQLHNEIEQRRKELEYRFTAFTGGTDTLAKPKN